MTQPTINNNIDTYNILVSSSPLIITSTAILNYLQYYKATDPTNQYRGLYFYNLVGVGQWSISTDSGATWFDVYSYQFSGGSVGSPKVSCLIKELISGLVTWFRYTPTAAVEIASLNLCALDHDPAIPNNTGYSNGGVVGTAISSPNSNDHIGDLLFLHNLTINVVTSLHNQPTLGSPYAQAFEFGVARNSTSPAILISDVLTKVNYNDPNSPAYGGIAVTGVTATSFVDTSGIIACAGTWQYSTDGITWTGFGTVPNGSTTTTAALLLSNSTYVRYVAANQYEANVTLNFAGWDQYGTTSSHASTNGTQSYWNLSNEPTAFTAAYGKAILWVNEAPHSSFSGVVPVSPCSVGQQDSFNSIFNLVQEAGYFGSDYQSTTNSPGLRGVAITSLSATHGTWYWYDHTTDSPLNMTPLLSTVSTTHACILPPVFDNTRGFLQFSPSADDGAGSIQFYLYDATQLYDPANLIAPPAWSITGGFKFLNPTSFSANTLTGQSTPFSTNRFTASTPSESGMTQNLITQVNVTVNRPPAPNKLQSKVCFISQGGTTTSAGVTTLITDLADLVAIIGSGSPATEVTAMFTTYFAQGSNYPAYVLELGAGSAASRISAFSTYLTNNPNAFYVYTVPRGWDAESTYVTLVGNHNANTDKVYFYTTVTLSTYASFTTKNVYKMIEASGIPSTEFTIAFRPYWVASQNPSSTNQVPPSSYSFALGVTPYPITNSQKTTFEAANLNYIGTGAEGGISTDIDFHGVMANGDALNMWYSIDWVQINEQLFISNAIINGSNRQPPLYYNQAGIDYLQRVAGQLMGNSVSYGLTLGSVILTKLPQAVFIANINAGKYLGNAVVNAEPFSVYTSENPGDYAIGQYNGLTCAYTPQLGFKHIVFNLNVNLFA